MSRSSLAAATALLLALPANAGDYPTKPDDMDELCQSIGGSMDPSTSPKDRLWFMENCLCIDGIGCGVPGSPRFVARTEVVRRREAAQFQAELDQQAAQEKASAARRLEALKEARQACVPLADCLHRNTGTPQACEAMESQFEYDCSANLRDFEACGQAVKAASTSPGAADCQAALR